MNFQKYRHNVTSLVVTLYSVADLTVWVKPQYGQNLQMITLPDFASQYSLISGFGGLSLNSPVWVRNSEDEEWRPAHYAGLHRTFPGGKTSHTCLGDMRSRWLLWKDESGDEWSCESLVNLHHTLPQLSPCLNNLT